MFYHRVSALLLALPALSATTPSRRQASSLYVPFYGTSPNGFSSAPRGWNSFGLQAASSALQAAANWTYDAEHLLQQCSHIQPIPGFDYVCSMDSGWSAGCNGDEHGIPIPDKNVIPDIKALSASLHSQGLKLGVYVLPGAFTADADKPIEGTSIRIGDVFGTDVGNQPNCRTNFDYSKDGAQEWHDSVIRKYVSFGVDFIKLDYVTPGSPDAGASTQLPRDSSGSVAAFHRAIANNNASIRLDISWKLDRSEPYWSIWRANADSLRVDQDINNGNEDILTRWSTVLRTLDFYRQFIVEQIAPSRQGQPIMIRPDMDNLFVGNSEDISGLTDAQRYSQAIHWIGAGANLISGNDMGRLDELGRKLLNDPAAMEVAAFTAQWPMQPRNPGSGGNEARQLQAWIAGPSEEQAVVVLANYGPDPCLQGGCNPTHGGTLEGTQEVSVSLGELGIEGRWEVERVWGGGGACGSDHAEKYEVVEVLVCSFELGESALYRLKKV